MAVGDPSVPDGQDLEPVRDSHRVAGCGKFKELMQRD